MPIPFTSGQIALLLWFAIFTRKSYFSTDLCLFPNRKCGIYCLPKTVELDEAKALEPLPLREPHTTSSNQHYVLFLILLLLYKELSRASCIISWATARWKCGTLAGVKRSVSPPHGLAPQCTTDGQPPKLCNFCAQTCSGSGMGVNERPQLNCLSNALWHRQPMVGMATTNLKTLNGANSIRTLPVSMLRPCLRASAPRHPPSTLRQRAAVTERRGGGGGGWVGLQTSGD